MLLRSYAKRTKKADTGAAAVISALSKVRYIVNWVQLGSKAVAVAKMF